MSLDETGDSTDLQDLFDSIAGGPAKVVAPPPPAPDRSGDSDDLQDLFDSVATSVAAPPPAPPPPAAAAARSGDDGMGDSDDLQALFDTVASESVPANVGSSEHEMQDAAQEAVFNNLGKMARQLHDSLRGLGYDQALQEAASQIPDVSQRLSYITQMTEQAALRVLNATDIAKPLVEDMETTAAAMSARWERMFANQLSVDEFKALAADTRGFFNTATGKLSHANQQLTEIIMAQDFQDLTGQVIKKVVDMVQGFEQQLLKVLVEAMPEKRKAEVPDGLMNGPVINAVGRDDVVTDQAQVDDLLESLGF
ncbi:MAG: protein phosphatase CheZ [Rhodocyclaceae bacterium]|nr:protein phosphatase CheZ [Rhodocyclaceae bacterium]